MGKEIVVLVLTVTQTRANAFQCTSKSIIKRKLTYVYVVETVSTNQ